MKNTYIKRIEQIREGLPEKGIDTLLVLVEENRRYLSGFAGEDAQFDESAGALFITRDKLILATDTRFTVQAEKEAPLFETFCYKDGLAKSLPELLTNLGTKRLGFESIRVSVSQHEKYIEELTKAGLTIEMTKADDVVEELRVKKDSSEVEGMKRALEIAESAFLKVKAKLKPGMTEKEIAWDLEKEMRDAGADCISFSTIIAVGPNSALPHAIPGDRKIEPGQPLLFDWGAKLDGYCSDTSRTVILGEPDEKFNKIYKTLFEAQRLAIEAIKPGASTRAVDAVAREYIENTEFKGTFGHGLGHGVGLQVHEPPRLSPLRDTILEPGMIVTVEPGIYLADWGGIRLENMVLVTEDGAEVLNTLDYDDYIIPLK